MEVSGYCFDPITIRKHVSGYTSLTPKARHALRDIFDLIWESETMQVIDDPKMVSYLGVTKREWVGIKGEIFALPSAFIQLTSGVWSSKWLNKQKKMSSEIMGSNPRLQESYSSINNEPDDSQELDEIEEFDDFNEETSKKDAQTVEVYEEMVDNIGKGHISVSKNKKMSLFSEKERKKSVREKSQDINEALEKKMRGKYYEQ